MKKLLEIKEYLEKCFPPEYAEEFDNIGLLIGRCDKDVEKVLLCLDCNKNVVREAKDIGAQLIISHHPVIFNPLKAVTDDNDMGEMVISALENGISIYSAHTNLDSAPGGITDTVAKMLGLTPVSNMERNLGRICIAPEGTTAKTLTAKVKETFNLGALYSTFSEDKEIRKVAICNGGGGGSLVQTAVSLGADVYISGDLKHHEVSELKINGTADFIEIRHYDCEIIARDILKNKLSEKFRNEIELVISTRECSPLIDTNEIL